jgi:hypothetical protein
MEPVAITLVIVPAVGVIPPVAVNATDELVIEPLTVYTPLDPRLPEPLVAVIVDPITKPVVELMPVMVPVHGPLPKILPTVPVVLINTVLELVYVNVLRPVTVITEPAVINEVKIAPGLTVLYSKLTMYPEIY